MPLIYIIVYHIIRRAGKVPAPSSNLTITAVPAGVHGYLFQTTGVKKMLKTYIIVKDEGN